jgi:HSP20 family protein
MLVRTEPFRELDRLAHQMLGTTARPARKPTDVWRDGEQIVVHFDLPQMDPDSGAVDIERNVRTARAERRQPTGDGTEIIAAEHPRGSSSRQLILGDRLDSRVQALSAFAPTAWTSVSGSALSDRGRRSTSGR